MKSLVLTLKLEEYEKKRLLFFRYLLYLFISLTAFLFSTSSSYGQCEMKFEYEVEETNNESNIKITLREGNGPFTIRLYDVYKDEYIETKKLGSSFGTDDLIYFKNPAPSSYLISVTEESCNKERFINGKPIEISNKKG